MKLPESSKISNFEMILPYKYDRAELFNNDERSKLRFRYQTKLNLVSDLISKSQKISNVIDVGSAQGNYTLSAAAKGIYSIGIDLRRPYIKYAKMKAEEIERKNSDFIIANAEYLPFRCGSIDCAYVGELLEHLSEPKKVLEELNRVSTPKKSFLIFTTPNVQRFRQKKIRNYSNVLLSPKKDLDDLKYCADTHVFEFTKEELLSLLSDYFNVEYFSYLWLISPLAILFYRLPIQSSVIRKMENKLLELGSLAKKVSIDMICVTQHR